MPVLRAPAGGYTTCAPTTTADWYKGCELEYCYQIDIVVDNELILEIKSVDHISPVHEAQLLTYLRLSGISVGLLLNFNAAVLKEGIRRRRV